MKYMPHMNGVSCYFDCRSKIDKDYWGNLIGNDSISLYGAVCDNDGIEVVGSDSSYMKLTYAFDSGNVNTTRYVVMKNTSNVYANWKTIVGNEGATNKCSTIAMNANGLLQYTRGEIYSTIKCNEWHVVAWKITGGWSYLYIDGVLIGSSTGITGWADDTYFAKGSTWAYTDNNTRWRFCAVSDIAQSDQEIQANSAYLLGEYINGYKPYLAKYLVAGEVNYYTVENGVLKSVPIVLPLTAEQFERYGCDEKPSGSLLVPLYDGQVWCWIDRETTAKLVTTVTAIVGEQVLITNNADMSDETIDSIRNVVCDVSGTSLIAMSWDDGATWEYYDGSSWITSSTSGMTAETLSAITTAQWDSYLAGKTSKQFKFKFELSQADRLKLVKVNYTNKSKGEQI